MNRLVNRIVRSAWALLLIGVTVRSARSGERPNFLVIMADDCTYNDLPIHGGKNARTPNIDRLSSQGLTFNRAYLGEAICQPCRAELYTGQYPMRNGCAWNHSASRPDTTSLPHHLRALGYRAGLAGKVHVQPAAVFPFEKVGGFEPNCVRDPTRAHDLQPIHKFLTSDEDQPFCLVIALVDPHVPCVMGDASQYPPKKIELPPNLADTPRTRRDFGRYLAEITYMDGQVGEILEALDDSGHADDTLVLFTSEQGAQFPGCKWTNWDTGLHTALVARWPGRVAEGKRTDALVQYADVLPTIVQAAGGEPSKKNYDGSSFLSVLLGKTEKHREYVYGVHNNLPEGPAYPIRTISDGNYRYIRNLRPDEIYIEKHLMGLSGNGKLNNPYWATWVREAWTNSHTYELVKRYMHRPAEQLYHSASDPYELNDLATDAERGEIKKRLSAELDRWLSSQGDPGAAQDTPEALEAARRGKHLYSPTNSQARANSWPQFRGPNASGVAPDSDRLPSEIGLDRNVVWKIPVPRGHSSPALTADRIFLTAARDESLLTISIDRATGKTLWEREAPLRKREPIHRIGSYAQPSPATDGERVISFFGSSGLLCYGRDGEQLWYLPMGPFNNDFGAGASPILAGNRVILGQDHDEGSFVMAIDKLTGKVIWRTDRSEFPRGYATPVLWESDGRAQVVMSGTLRVVGYNLGTGEEAWTARGTSRLVNVTPTVGENGILYVSGWTSGGDADDRFDVKPFDEFLGDNDRDGDGLIVRDEVPGEPLKSRFNQIDRDKSGKITRGEYESMRSIMDRATNVCMAIRPGGSGDVSTTHVLWRHTKKLPYLPSPLVYRGFVFIVKKGGIVSSLDAKTGKPVKEGRVSAQGSYYSSPVAGDGKVYLINQRGDVSVIRATGDWEEISSSSLREETYATPALLGGRIYVRTTESLICFASPGVAGGD